MLYAALTDEGWVYIVRAATADETGLLGVASSMFAATIYMWKSGNVSFGRSDDFEVNIEEVESKLHIWILMIAVDPIST